LTAAQPAPREPPKGRSLPSVARCVHCAQPLLNDAFAPYCCRGCRTVHGILTRAGLTRYYDLRQGPGLPPADIEARRIDHKWLDLLEEERGNEGGVDRVVLDIQGIHCTACVWLIEELFRRHDGNRLGLMSINPALGRIDLRVSPDFPLAAWVDSVEELGYVLGPAKAGPEARPSDELLLRVGICTALAANVMLFAIAIYVGLREGPIYELLNQLSYAAGVLAVLVGGSVFIKSAVRALRRRMLHLDVPIALGIVLAFAGSTWSFFFAAGHAAYIDTLTVFVALMLVGRWLQQRMLERNRAQLLADDGTEGLLTREVKDDVVRIVHCIAIREGHCLLIAPGDLVPVDLRITDNPASCSLDWIDGESTPRDFLVGDTVPAGAFNVGGRAFTGIATSDFSASTVVGLLRNDSARSDVGTMASQWWSRLSRYYVLGVITLAATAIGLWWWSDGPLRAIEVGTAVLVVTCPCAFGIAAPLAYELVLTELRRAGIFVRVGDFLDRVRTITRIVFDKTGTLTTGTLVIDDPEAFAGLSDFEMTILYNMAARSAHPKSVALRRALEGHESARFMGFEVEEQAGRGISAQHGGHHYRLGAPGWAGESEASAKGDVTFTVDGRLVASLSTGEELRPGARDEVDRLAAEGYELSILSGDAAIRVKTLGASLGMPEDVCIGGQSPQQKAAYVREHEPARTLLVGDGLNDRVAMEAAACSGTPAVNRPFMASRCDFYFVSPGLRPVAQVLHSSEELAQVVRRVLAFAIAYNLVAVSLAMSGLVKPWIAAVLMPLSSLITLGYTMMALSQRRARWKS